MPTASDLMYQTRSYLYTGSKDERNKLNGAITDTTSLTMTLSYDARGIQRGTKLAIDQECFYVWSIAGQTATVERGRFGSTAATHADGSMVYVNPRWSDFDIFGALNDELRALSGRGLFRMRTADVTYQPAVEGYDLTGVSDLISVYELRWKPVDVSASWPKITHYTLARNMNTSEFSSGTALLIYDSPAPGRTVHVRYKAPFGTLTAVTDDVGTVSGLHPEAMDLLPIGAAIRLAAGREVRRNFDETQGDTRRADEVPPGANLNAIRQLQTLYATRLGEETGRLAAEYPITRGVVW